jgi:hypothetical protein
MGKHDDYTEQELAGLGPEERAALDADMDSDDKASLNPREEFDDDPEEEEDLLEGEAEKTPAVAAGKPAEQAEEEDSGERRIVLDVPKVEVTPEYKAALADLDTKFTEGELTLTDYNTARDALVQDHMTKVVSANVTAEINQQVETKTWQANVKDFLDDPKHTIYKTDPILYNTLNEQIKALAADSANSEKTDRWILNEAHAQVAARFKTGEEVPRPKPKDPKKEAIEARRPNLASVPKTLSDVPAAAGMEGDNEFASLEQLEKKDSAAYERALARMTPDQERRFLGTA